MRNLAKKILFFTLGLFTLFVLFMGLLSWVKNGGDTAVLMNASNNAKVFSSVIQLVLLSYLYIKWETVIVQKSQPKAQIALRSAKNPICVLALIVLMLFTFL